MMILSYDGVKYVDEKKRIKFTEDAGKYKDRGRRGGPCAR